MVCVIVVSCRFETKKMHFYYKKFAALQVSVSGCAKLFLSNQLTQKSGAGFISEKKCVCDGLGAIVVCKQKDAFLQQKICNSARFVLNFF